MIAEHRAAWAVLENVMTAGSLITSACPLARSAAFIARLVTSVSTLQPLFASPLARDDLVQRRIMATLCAYMTTAQLLVAWDLALSESRKVFCGSGKGVVLWMSVAMQADEIVEGTLCDEDLNNRPLHRISFESFCILNDVETMFGSRAHDIDSVRNCHKARLES